MARPECWPEFGDRHGHESGEIQMYNIVMIAVPGCSV